MQVAFVHKTVIDKIDPINFFIRMSFGYFYNYSRHKLNSKVDSSDLTAFQHKATDDIQ